MTELAGPFEMTQPAISKHLKVLQRAGLISRDRDAQRRPIRFRDLRPGHRSDSPRGPRQARVIFPAVTVARTTYCGDYTRLGKAWVEFHAWIRANGHLTSSDLYECYLVGPESSPNPADWRTELSQPLAS